MLSSLAVARVCPSGANATARTASVWPVSGSPRRRGSGRVADIPQQHRVVGAGGGQGVPVRGERHRLSPRRCGRSAGRPGGAGRVGSVTSHSSTVLSSLAVARVCPSGANATASPRRCGRSAGRPGGVGRVGSLTSHSSTVLSALAVARVRPSGANATACHRVGVAGQRVPSRRGRVGSLTSHSSTVLSSLAVARVRPSGANATP